MAEEICDNCDVDVELTVLNYKTKRKDYVLTLCPNCFNKFYVLVKQLNGVIKKRD